MFTLLTQLAKRLGGKPGNGDESSAEDAAKVDAGSEPLQVAGPGCYLDVPTCNNVRELGGYATPSGVTLYHRFLRSADTCFLDQRDIDRLMGYGVSYVVDLRGEVEARQAPDRLGRLRRVKSLRVQLHNHNIRDDFKDGIAAMPDDDEHYMAKIYLRMMQNRTAIKRIFEFMAKAGPDDCVLFHCAAGMDRTGITSLLILGLCEVSRDDIIRDYLYSFCSPEQVERLIAGERAGETHDAYGIGTVTLTHTMSLVYQWVLDNYGSARGYLLSCGLSQRTLDRVKAHLLG